MTVFRASGFRSIVEPILERAKAFPDQVALTLINSDESERPVTIREMHAGAVRYARAFEKSGVRQGDVVIIALGHGLDLICALWGALYTGAIPSVFYYPGPMSPLESYRRRLQSMLHHSSARLAVTLAAVADSPETDWPGRRCELLSPEHIRAGSGGGESESPGAFTSGEEIAYLQFTSGTTGTQKGVMLSHRAILGCLEAMARAFQLTAHDVFVNWLPLYHDFGLFAGFFLPLISALPAVLLSPFKWLRKPQAFLWAIHHHRGTISFLPNSAHHHTAGSVSDRDIEGLDLGSLRILINGSEPVLYQSQELFLRRFAPRGFKETALNSGYGMAENTLGVTFTPPGKRSPVDWVEAKEMKAAKRAIPAAPQAEGAKPCVSSGIPLPGVEVAILDHHGHHLPEREVGEIAIRSGFLFSGYHSRPDLTRQVIKRGWYSTGDIGYLTDNELHVCGRKADLIIVGGHNIHPEDLEAIAHGVPGVLARRVVAFGITDPELGTEKIILVCEVQAPHDEEGKLRIERELRRRVYNELEVTLGEVRLVGKGWVKRTPNGKIARAASRQKYEESFREGRDA
jgi:acyl-CoA synthetase (AMP-forming)/AMP-acid ligase II